MSGTESQQRTPQRVRSGAFRHYTAGEGVWLECSCGWSVKELDLPKAQVALDAHWEASDTNGD